LKLSRAAENRNTATADLMFVSRSVDVLYI
jgi:hypothetical protein